MSEIEYCPVCQTIMRDVPGIGPWCPLPECPVEDDALLWSRKDDGTWERKPGPFVEQQPDTIDSLRAQLQCMREALEDIALLGSHWSAKRAKEALADSPAQSGEGTSTEWLDALGKVLTPEPTERSEG